jgi:hypothetical protein
MEKSITIYAQRLFTMFIMMEGKARCLKKSGYDVC